MNELEQITDKYFTKTRHTVEQFGDSWVTYAFFIRNNTLFSKDLVNSILDELKMDYQIHTPRTHHEVVPSGEVLFYLEGWFSELAELETVLLQRIGFATVCAYNAYTMAEALPNVKFMDMAARHLPDPETHQLAAYGAAYGTYVARNEDSSINGFIGSSTDETARYYGASKGNGQ